MNTPKILRKILRKSTKEDSNDLEYLAFHDEMTGLKNKRAYDAELKTFAPTNTIIYLDVNKLKETNDKYGHEQGDLLIKTIANQIQEKFEDAGYRIGGDEFIVLAMDTKEIVEQKIKDIKEYLQILTNTNEAHLTYSVAIGYVTGQSDDNVKDLVKTAEKKMYQEKKKSKQESIEEEIENPTATDVDYDSLLTKDQRELKEQVVDIHEPVTEESVERIVLEIQQKLPQIKGILIASKTFDHIFILINPRTFLSIVQKMEFNLDFSYIYVLYEGGPQYYGVDEYTSEITHLFEAISENILARTVFTKEDLLKIKGINIFKEIYTDIG